MARTEYGRDTKILWQDRKRFMGLPITFTSYQIVQKQNSWTKLIIKSGILSTRTDELMLYRIDDLQTHQSIFDKLFGVGSITIFCNDASSPQVYLTNVANFQKVYNYLSELIQQDRARVKMGHGEFQS